MLPDARSLSNAPWAGLRRARPSRGPGRPGAARRLPGIALRITLGAGRWLAIRRRPGIRPRLFAVDARSTRQWRSGPSCDAGWPGRGAPARLPDPRTSRHAERFAAAAPAAPTAPAATAPGHVVIAGPAVEAGPSSVGVGGVRCLRRPARRRRDPHHTARDIAFMSLQRRRSAHAIGSRPTGNGRHSAFQPAEP